jgi:hypothetical protein
VIVIEITPEIVVYRYSPAKLVEYLRVKVSRLSNPQIFEGSRTLIRGLARDGLMEDGKEELLECTSGNLRWLVSVLNLILQLAALELRATSLPNISPQISGLPFLHHMSRLPIILFLGFS